MPFQITTHPFGPAQPDTPDELIEYRLENTDTGEVAAIVPGHGAILRQLILLQKTNLVTVVHGPDSPQALRADETYAGTLLYPFPGRIRHGQYTFNGQAYQLPVNEQLRGHALHGLVFNRPFAVVSQEITDESAALTLRYDYDGHKPGYPFSFRLVVVYQLITSDLPGQSSTFQLFYTSRNTGDVAAPAGFGWHPYFSINNQPLDGMSLQLPHATTIVLGDDMIPTGAPGEPIFGSFSLKDRTLDTPFRLEPAPDQPVAETVLTDHPTGHRLVIGQQTGPGWLNHLVVFTPPRRDRIAIEPQTANADAFNNADGLVTLAPDETLTGVIWVGLR